MINDFVMQMTDTGAVVRKELKIEPAEFDKQFLAYIDSQTKNVVANLSKWKEGVKHLARTREGEG